MSRIKSKTLSFAPSSALDVAGYRLYYCPDTEELSYDSPSVDLGLNVVVTIPDQVPKLGALNGVYKIAASAYDTWGNESDLSEVVTVPFDFVAPDAPGAVVIS